MSYPALNRGPWAPLLIVSCPCILVQRPDLAPCLASPASFPAACLNRNARAHVLPKSSALGGALVLIVSCLILDRGSWRLTPPLYSVLRRPLVLASRPCLLPCLASSHASCSLFLSAAAACRLPPPPYLDLRARASCSTYV